MASLLLTCPTALHYRLYDTIPNVPGGNIALDRQSSKASTSSRPLSASSSRPKSVLDFMLSPSSSVSSPRRTLSKASKASTLDSGIGSQRSATSIFSNGHASAEYASTTQTSVNSHEHPGSPYKRPATSAGPTGTGSADHMKSTGELANRRSMSRLASRSSKQLAEAASLVPDAENNVEELDQNSLARSRSDGQLYQSTSEQSLGGGRRNRSGTLSRTTSTQSMRIDEEAEELDDDKVLARECCPCVSFDATLTFATTARTPPRDCLSPLQRNGTLSRPHGPRQLGSKSPILSPRVLPAGPSRSRTPSDDEDNPFIQNLRSSTGRKRYHEDEGGDDSSISSKRALRATAALQNDSARASPKPRGSDPKSRGKVTDRREQGKNAAVARSAAHKDYSTDLQRTGSLPRSPHTRSLYQQSRPAGSEAATPITQLPSSAVKGPASSRLPRKPAPAGSDIEMELSLVRKQSIAERATVVLTHERRAFC